ncbi:MAG: hypothetical protein MJZ64_00145 [Paludibacteraceae bacterium]|nr:hypothetical protein [Paludibacteraceae bacterium]
MKKVFVCTALASLAWMLHASPTRFRVDVQNLSDTKVDLRITDEQGSTVSAGHYQWYRDGRPIDNAISPTYSTTQEGEYACLVDGQLTYRHVIVDCDYQLLFDDHGADQNWFNVANWYPNYDHLPNALSKAAIQDNKYANVAQAESNGVAVAQHLTMLNGAQLVVQPSGRLAVDSISYHTGSNLTIRTDMSHAGAVSVAEGSPLTASTSVYGKATSDGKYGTDVIWQFTAIPLNSGLRAEHDFYGGWMTKWTENQIDASGQLGGCWSWIGNTDYLQLFHGYALTQNRETSYTFHGSLPTKDYAITGLTYTMGQGDGYHLLGNSYSAPIDVAAMNATDFHNTEMTFYLLHYGSQDQQQKLAEEGSLNITGSPNELSNGQYYALPLYLAKEGLLANTLIPSMQGFFVQTIAPDASISFDYERVVHQPNKNATTSAPSAYSPTREKTGAIYASLTAICSTTHFADAAKLFLNKDCSDDFDNGWDGKKMQGSTASPQIYWTSDAGQWQYQVTNQADSVRFEVIAGTEPEITLRIDRSKMGNYYPQMWLKDLQTGTSIDLNLSNQYTYSDVSGSTRQFLLTSRKNTPSAITAPTTKQSTKSIYDILGRQVTESPSSKQSGMYIIVDDNGTRKEVIL